MGPTIVHARTILCKDQVLKDNTVIQKGINMKALISEGDYFLRAGRNRYSLYG